MSRIKQVRHLLCEFKYGHTDDIIKLRVSGLVRQQINQV